MVFSFFGHFKIQLLHFFWNDSKLVLTSKLAEDSHFRICPLTFNFSELPFHCGILEGEAFNPPPGGVTLDLKRSREPLLFSKEGGDEISLRKGTFLLFVNTVAPILGLGGTGGGILVKSVRDPKGVDPKGVDRPEEPLKGVGIFDLNGFGVKIVAGNDATDKVEPSRLNILMSDNPTVFRD